MGYIPVTPFRRLVEAAHLEQHRQATAPITDAGVNKWEVLRELGVARTRFGLSDRDVAVLQALISFHPGTILTGRPIVYPSNATICARLNGMANSTMRRHLANLVASGFVWRRDSPNGKRYVRRGQSEPVVYGLDLTPLVTRCAEITEMAEAERAAAEQLAGMRETVSLMRRDLAALAIYGEDRCPGLPLWPQISDMAILTARMLRRRLTIEAIHSLHQQLSEALCTVRAMLEPQETEEMSSTNARNEQHYQKSDEDSYESELAENNELPSINQPNDEPASVDSSSLPLGMIVAACPEIQTYTEKPIQNWDDLQRGADTVRPMMGIPQDVWHAAKRSMGQHHAAIVLAAMLERFSEIRSPGAYLRSLSQKAREGVFSSGPMVTALLRRAA